MNNKKYLQKRDHLFKVQDYADGFKVFHNFVRKGVKDKKTPAERCGIEINGNAWNTLLINAIKQKATQLTTEENMIKSH